MATPSKDFPGWNKTNPYILVHESGKAKVTTKMYRTGYYGPARYHVYANGDWVYQREITGAGQWIGDFETLNAAIAEAEKRIT